MPNVTPSLADRVCGTLTELTEAMIDSTLVLVKHGYYTHGMATMACLVDALKHVRRRTRSGPVVLTLAHGHFMHAATAWVPIKLSVIRDADVNRERQFVSVALERAMAITHAVHNHKGTAHETSLVIEAELKIADRLLTEYQKRNQHV